jgi:glycosyltransferase involved in cell wall biosynthesis
MLRIAMVVGSGQSRVPAGSTRAPHVVTLSDALVDAGHDVTVLSERRGLTAALRRCAPDVVHAYGRYDEAAVAARALDIPFVLSPAAATDVRDVRADHFLVPFSGMQQQLVAAGVARHHTSVVPYGVDLDRFTPDGDHTDRRRPHRVVTMGTMTRSSGFGTVIAALPALPDAELVVISESRNREHSAELRGYARALDVADQIDVMDSPPRTEVPALLRSADLMVCSAWEPAFGVPALEAMACGLAVIANSTGGLVDTVVDRVTGIHVRPRKPRELATARGLLSHRSTYEQLGAAGRDRATARYSWERVAIETLHAYRRAGVTDPAVLEQETAAAARKRGTA